MKTKHYSVLALLVALFAMASVGAGSASADSLCKVNESPCPAGEAYSAGEVIKATSENMTLTGGINFVFQCTASLEAVIGEGSGAEGSVTGEVTKFAVAGCKGSCKSGSELNVPYAFDLSATGGGDGVFDVTSGGKGNPGFVLHNCMGLGMACSYSTGKIRLQASGGSPAVLSAEDYLLARYSGPCPAIATMNADFVVSSPAAAWVQE